MSTSHRHAELVAELTATRASRARILADIAAVRAERDRETDPARKDGLSGRLESLRGDLGLVSAARIELLEEEIRACRPGVVKTRSSVAPSEAAAELFALDAMLFAEPVRAAS